MLEQCIDSRHFNRNVLYVYPDFGHYSARLLSSTSSRNITIKVELKENDKDLNAPGLPVICGKYGESYLQTSVYTEVSYHSKNKCICFFTNIFRSTSWIWRWVQDLLTDQHYSCSSFIIHSLSCICSREEEQDHYSRIYSSTSFTRRKTDQWDQVFYNCSWILQKGNILLIMVLKLF